ncbi:hypothetical protein AYJ54_40660 [Bradyrhizobium centrolobii]|uniref:Uncharacterized protein n=1 Tax=Bradyrhizobium centrolobii TaxID=1505087 RepID=A0A176Z571_9BRAD|nr:hypothetical protein AYJ54_40660 [Bradyrhizobium centrolobii]
MLLASIFACAFAAPALSQAVVEYPGACAQFYPDANCENYGPGNPYSGGDASRDLAANAFMASPVRHPSLRKHRAR